MARKNATEFKRILEKGELGFLCSKKHLEEQRQLAFVSSGAQPFNEVLQAAEDVKVHDTTADDEADQLDIEIEWERNDQKRWKKDHRMQMEKQEKWVVVSCWERKAALMKLADCLTSNERSTWLEEREKLDKMYRD